MIAIRGAITVNENSSEEILEGTKQLMLSIIDENNVDTEDIISVFFHCYKRSDKGISSSGRQRNRSCGLCTCVCSGTVC